MKSVDADNYFLLGDIIDAWSFRETHFWKESHTEVLKILLKKAKKSRVVYIPGNHDYEFRRFDGMEFGNISVHREFIYETVSGKQILLTHGDLYDSVIQDHKFIVILGCYLYDKLIIVSHYLSVLRSMAGRVHWSLTKFLKRKVKSAVNYIGNFEETLVKECLSKNISGLICGHIHNPEIRTINEITYMNTGDWVETCSAICETDSGEFHLIELVNGRFKTRLIHSF